MNKIVEIIIELNGERYYLDYDAVDGIRLNYNINRIQDLTALDSSYSQSIKLINSKNNQNVLGFISNLNVINGTFNPNLKTRAFILIDGVVVFEGSLQLLSIEYDDDKSIFYEAVIYADNANLYTAIENKFLQDLDFSKYNYIFDRDTFLSTATSSCDRDAIIFPIIDYGANWKYNQISGTGSNLGLTSSQIDLEEVYPATYVKSIVDQIFIDAGYKYESNFFNSQDYKKLIIPFTNEDLKSSITSTDDVLFFGSATTSFFTQSSTNDPTKDFNIIYNTNINNSSASSRFNIGSQSYTNDNFRRYERFGVDLDLSLLLSRWDYERTGTPDDTLYFRNQATEVRLIFYRQFNPATQTIDSQPINEFYYKILFNSNNNNIEYQISSSLTSTDFLDFFSKEGFTKPNGAINPNIRYNVGDSKLRLERNAFSVFYDESVPVGFVRIFNEIGRLTSTETIYTPFLDGSEEQLIPLFPGEQITCQIQVRYRPRTSPLAIYFLNGALMFNAYNNYPSKSTSLGFSNLYDGIGVLTSTGWVKDNSLTYINNLKNEPTSIVSRGTSLPISLNLPENVKQIDFLKSIIKMFNLYIEPVKNKLNTFKIEPRDDYYSGSEVKDWSSKVDLSQIVSSDILSNTQAKETILKYTDDDDFDNELYRKSFNETYGEYKYILNNEFITGQNVIEVIFSPTVLRNIYDSDIIISAIQKDLNYNQVQKVGSNIRILYCDLINLPSDKTISIDGAIFTQYIYAGHFDNPYDPSLDLSFILPKKVYYDNKINGQPKLTYNSLYNTYHRNQFSEINNNDSRLVKVYVKLDEVDIYNFKFSDTIYLYVNDNVNGYFRLNSINGYDPLTQNSCEVELIKIDFTPTTNLITNTSVDVNQIRPNSLNLGSLNKSDNPAIMVGRRNTIQGVGNEVSGEGNIIVGNNVKVKGDNNIINGDEINISGSFNELIGNKIEVIGSKNISATNSIINSKINGDQNIINQPVNNLQLFGSQNEVGVTSSSDVMNSVFFYGDSTIINDEYLNKLITADDITINAKRIVAGGKNNTINSSTGLILGDGNIIETGCENNFIIGNTNSVVGTSSFNFVLGTNNTMGPNVTNGVLIGNNNEINKIGGGSLDNVFIQSNSNAVYNLTNNIHLIDLQEGRFSARSKTGLGNFDNKIFPEVSSYQSVQYSNSDYVNLISQGVTIPDRFTNPTASIPRITKYRSLRTGPNTDIFLGDKNDINDIYFSIPLLMSGTQSVTKIIDRFDDEISVAYNFIIDIETMITRKGNYISGQTNSFFHTKNTLYVYNAGLINLEISNISQNYFTSSFTFSITQDFGIISFPIQGISSTINSSVDFYTLSHFYQLSYICNMKSIFYEF